MGEIDDDLPPQHAWHRRAKKAMVPVQVTQHEQRRRRVLMPLERRETEAAAVRGQQGASQDVGEGEESGVQMERRAVGGGCVSAGAWRTCNRGRVV